jgi:hypothetical protein
MAGERRRLNGSKSRVVRLDQDIFECIRDHAEPFEDGVSSTLRKMLGMEDPDTPTWSFQARLARLGQALSNGDEKIITRELADIKLAYRSGVFGE